MRFIEVTYEEFFATVGRLNVHPRPEKDASYWEMQDGSRRLMGKTTPGYMCEGRKAYFVVRHDAA